MFLYFIKNNMKRRNTQKTERADSKYSLTTRISMCKPMT